MDYTSQHIGRINATKRIDRESLRAGMIIYGTYTDRKGGSERSMWLVLQGKYKGLTHALSLAAIAPQRLISLALQTKVSKSASTGYSRLNLNLTATGEATGQKQFYNSTLKAQLKANLAGSYRTLEPKRLKNLLVVDYKWPNNISPQQKEDES